MNKSINFKIFQDSDMYVTKDERNNIPHNKSIQAIAIFGPEDLVYTVWGWV